jgi:hypothetical protein
VVSGELHGEGEKTAGEPTPLGWWVVGERRSALSDPICGHVLASALVINGPNQLPGHRSRSLHAQANWRRESMNK